MNDKLPTMVTTAGEYLSAGATTFWFLVVALFVVWLIEFVLSSRALKSMAWPKAYKRPTQLIAFLFLMQKGLSQGVCQIKRLNIGEDSIAMRVDRGLTLIWLVIAVVVVVKVTHRFFSFEVERQHDIGIRHKSLLAEKFVVGLTLVAALYIALDTLKIDTKPFLAGGAIGGVIIGLALQQSLANIFAGLVFSLDGAIRVGDLVRLGSGKEGHVEDVGWRTTSIRLWDDCLLVIPNSVVAGDTIENLSRPFQTYVVKLELCVKTGQDYALAESTAMKVMDRVQAPYRANTVLKPPFLRWTALSEAGTRMNLYLPITTPEAQYRAKSELVKTIQADFASAGIQLGPAPA